MMAVNLVHTHTHCHYGCPFDTLVLTHLTHSSVKTNMINRCSFSNACDNGKLQKGYIAKCDIVNRQF